MQGKNTVPVTFNTYKHHFRFLLGKIEGWKNQDWEQIEKELLGIGENLADLYTGRFSVGEILFECAEFFKKNRIFSKDVLLSWLNPLEYRKITLGDSSVWIIKAGNDKEKYIHIHPAKKSPHSIRVRAATLKTVITLMILTDEFPQHLNEGLETVNRVRTQYLHLSPVKSLQRGQGIYQLWELFFMHFRQHCC